MKTTMWIAKEAATNHRSNLFGFVLFFDTDFTDYTDSN